MPRNAGGIYSLPPGNPVVPLTIIETDWANPTMEDIAIALSDSLSRSGLGGMLVPFKNTDGTQAAPGMTWQNEPTSGWYRKAPQQFWYSVAGQDIFGITAAGITLAPGLVATGISSFIIIQDAQPVTMLEGEEWYESDTGGLYMRYVNPDLTETLVSLGTTGGDFIPFNMKGQANGVAELDGGGDVPLTQLGNIQAVTIPLSEKGAPNGVATLDAGGKIPESQLPTAAFIPPGTVWDYAGGPGAPAGWLLCDGAAVSRVTFAALFTAIGVTWGVGDGATTFNVPDFRRRATVGAGGTGTATLGNAVGNVGGEEDHVLTVAEMPAHTHTVTVGGGAAFGQPSGAVPQSASNTGSTGGDGAHNTIQPSAIVVKMIKV